MLTDSVTGPGKLWLCFLQVRAAPSQEQCLPRLQCRSGRTSLVGLDLVRKPFPTLISIHSALLQAQRGSPGPGGALDSTVQKMAPVVKICDKPVKVSSPPSTMVVTQPLEGQDGPPSPLSEASSGYFSHSVSTATLSETLTLGLDTTGLGSQTPGSPPALCQVTPEPELAFLSCTQSHPPASEEPQVPPATPTQSTELEVPRPPLLSESTSTVPTSPFRIRKVRTSELKSFTGMLGGASSGAGEDPLASEELSSARGQTLGRLEVSSDSEEASEVPEWLREGEYVVVGTNKTGIVRYIGPTDFQEGTWIGVELDLPSGKWAVGAPAEHDTAECGLGTGMCCVPSAHQTVSLLTLHNPDANSSRLLECTRGQRESPKTDRNLVMSLNLFLLRPCPAVWSRMAWSEWAQ